MLEGSWVPQDRAEERMMEDIHHATRRAHRDGVSRRRVAACLAFMASAAIDPKSDENAEHESVSADEAREKLKREIEERKAKEPRYCPDCEDEIAGVSSEVGGRIFVQPCGCEYEWEVREQLGDWADDLDPEVEDD